MDVSRVILDHVSEEEADGCISVKLANDVTYKRYVFAAIQLHFLSCDAHT